MSSRRIISSSVNKTPTASTTNIDNSNNNNSVKNKTIKTSTKENEEKEKFQPSSVPTHVICKLLGFTLAMVVGPISCYFLSLNWIFNGNSTYAGATAAITANLVLIAYVIVAFREDQDEASIGRDQKKKF